MGDLTHNSQCKLVEGDIEEKLKQQKKIGREENEKLIFAYSLVNKKRGARILYTFLRLKARGFVKIVSFVADEYIFDWWVKKKKIYLKSHKF